MRKLINIVFGLIFGMFPLIASALIGAFLLDATPLFLAIILLIILSVLSCWIGVGIFKRVQIVGFIEFITGVIASPDLDNLKTVENDETKNRKVDELVHLIIANKSLLKGGTLRIFGDWYGEPHDNYRKIISASFDSDLNCLKIDFQDNETLKIYHPKYIFESPKFLKIVDASSIELHANSFNSKSQNPIHIRYSKKSKEILSSNKNNITKGFDEISVGQAALMIYK